MSYDKRLDDFIKEDGSFTLNYTGHGSLEVDCVDGECSVEVFAHGERYEGSAESPEELYACLYSGLEKLTEEGEDVDEFVDDIIAYMDTSYDDEVEWDDEDDDDDSFPSL